MSENDNQDQGTPSERIVALETLFTHIEHAVGELNQVVLAQQKQIEALERTIRAMRTELDSLAGAVHQTPRPQDEKPPHY